MHASAFEYVRRTVQSLPPLYRVAELGARVHNGSVREVFTDATAPGGTYMGIDLLPGPGVDLVADVTEWRTPRPFDCVVSTELLEHCPRGPAVCRSAFLALRPGGVFVVTCAGEGREPHGAGGGPPGDGEWYRNVTAGELARWCKDAGFAACLIDPLAPPGDLYALAMRVR